MSALIIVASGQATRVEEIHQNLYPKLLMNVGNETVLDKIICSFSNVANDIHIILASMLQVQQVTEYLQIRNYENKNFTFHITENSPSSGMSLKTHLEYLPQEAYITWSDIWPVHCMTELPKWHTSKDVTTIFTDVNHVHRYYFDGTGKPLKSSTGNVCGIYHTTNLQKVLSIDLAETSDFVDYLLNTDKLQLVNEDINIVDTGDMTKYNKVIYETEVVTRFFNNLAFTDTEVIKTPLTAQGKRIAENEIAWYEYFKQKADKLSINRLVPQFRVVDEKLHLEKIDGFILEEAKYMLPAVIDSLKSLHYLDCSDADYESLIKEYIHVPQSRIAQIHNILPEISEVNGLNIFPKSVDAFFEKVIEYCKSVKQFKFIHGDPNSSNVMIDKTGQVKFIDPRGIFGNTKILGDANYDFAKLMYGITGYTQFNKIQSMRFHNLGEGRFRIPIFADYEQLKFACKQNNFSKDILMLVILIWYKLPAYTINDVNKAICAYAQALYLIEQFNNDKELF